MILCALITSYSCKILIASAQMTHCSSYEYLGLKAVGENNDEPEKKKEKYR